MHITELKSGMHVVDYEGYEFVVREVHVFPVGRYYQVCTECGNVVFYCEETWGKFKLKGESMKVVIIGARLGRDDAADKILVDQIIDDCKQRYAKLIIVTKSGDKGVGKFILDRCRTSKEAATRDFDMIELSLRHILEYELPKQEFLGNFNALNAALMELGDEFHLLTEEHPTGAMSDIIGRLRQANVPYAIYKPSEVANGPKNPNKGV